MKKLSEAQRLVLRSVADGDKFGQRYTYAAAEAARKKVVRAAFGRTTRSLCVAGLLRPEGGQEPSGYKFVFYTITDAGRAALAEEEYVASMAAFAAEVSKP